MLKQRFLFGGFFSLLFFLLIASLNAKEVPKLCWAHYVGWGFDHVGKYDQWATSESALDPLTDRPLSGKNIQWDSGVSEGTRRQINDARLWGFDGFTVDVVNIESAQWIMSRFYRAAEGTTFKVSLCIDNHRQLTPDFMAEHLGNFIRKYKDHPNSALIEGRMVIFAYSIGMPIDDWLKVRTILKDQGLDAYYLTRPMGEGSMWNDPNKLAECLRGSEGLYDFGCNGFTLEQMITRLENGRKALAAHRPDGILVAGIAPGYLGQSTGFYRPFLRSESLRNNWEAAIRAGADQVCITTWNDYVEHTHFEPSVVNRSALLRINQEWIAKWRKELPPKRPPETIFSYQEEVLFGNDLTFEVLNFSYSTAAETVHLRFLNEEGKTIHQFDPVPLPKDQTTATTLRLTNDDIKAWGTVRVQAVQLPDGQVPKEDDYLELWPIVRRFGKLESARTVRIPLKEQSLIPIKLALIPDAKQIKGEKSSAMIARIALKCWSAAGRLELLRNGYPVAEREVNHIKKPVCIIDVPILEKNRAGKDVWLARFTNSSDGLGLSNPVTKYMFDDKTTSLQPVLVTGADFDENWPIWYERISRLSSPFVEKEPVSKNDIFSVEYRFDKECSGPVPTVSGWNIPLYLTSAANKITWKKMTGPEGKEQTVLWFDGQTTGRLPSRSFPAGAYTLEMIIQTATDGSSDGTRQVLFRDGAGMSLVLDSSGIPTVSDRKATLRGKSPLVAGQWVRLKVVNDMNSVALYVNDKEEDRAKIPLRYAAINSVSFLGRGSEGEGFIGAISEFRLEGKAPENRP